MAAASDSRAALLSALLPGSGQLVQGRRSQALTAFGVALLLIVLSAWVGRVTDRAVEVLVFMVLALPWWVLQSYDAYLGAATSEGNAIRTWRTVRQQGHDIRFLGALLEPRLPLTVLLHETRRSSRLRDQGHLSDPPYPGGIRLPAASPLVPARLPRLCRLWVDEWTDQSDLLRPRPHPQHPTGSHRPLHRIYPMEASGPPRETPPKGALTAGGGLCYLYQQPLYTFGVSWPIPLRCTHSGFQTDR